MVSLDSIDVVAFSKKTNWSKYNTFIKNVGGVPRMKTAFMYVELNMNVSLYQVHLVHLLR